MKFSKIKEMPLAVKISLAHTMCSVLQNGLSFFTLFIFTRLLTTEQYGQYSIYSSWSAILAIFITLNSQYGSFSKAMVKFEKRRNEYLASIEGICLVLAMLFLMIYLPFRKYWNILFELPTALVIIMIVEIIANFSITCWSGRERFEFKYKSVIAVTLLTSFVAPIVAFLLVQNSSEKGYARIVGYAVVNIMIGMFFLGYNLLKGKRIYTKEYWQYALNFNIPLVVYYLSQVVFNQSDRIMISHYCGKAEAGIYGVAYSLAMILNFVLNAINNSYVPWFYGKLKEEKEKENQSISCIIASLMAVLLLGIIWLAPEIILIMSGENYYSAIWIVPPVAMSVLLLFYSQLFINVEFYYEEKKELVYASIGSSLINIILNAMFIPKWGFIVAGYTTLISYIVFALANYYAMKKILKIYNKKNEAYNVKILVAILVVFALCSGIGMCFYEFPIIRYGIILLVITIMLFNLKKIKQILSKLSF